MSFGSQSEIQWEYQVVLLEADAKLQQEYLARIALPGEQIKKFDIRAILPELNTLGAQGWELVSFEPVNVGRNGDIQLFAYGTTYYAHTFMCTFKRRVR
jgi:hypothetical protein